MNKNIKITAALLLSFFSFSSYGIDVSEINEWDKDNYYQRGDLTSHKKNVYLSSFPSTNFSPSKYKWFWKKINLKSNNPLKLKKFYFGGSVLNHDSKKFIAKSFSLLWSYDDLANTKVWLEITDKTDGYDLPEFDKSEALENILGTDTNNNGIRDDYETKVILSDLPRPLKSHALKAGKIYTTAMKSGHSGISTKEEAIFIAQGLIHSYRCKLQVAKDNKGHSWKESYFYNTVDRLKVKFATSNSLAKLIGKNGEFEFPEDACTALTNFNQG